jgi:endothelin-converting enzyme/putative endopeptidase
MRRLIIASALAATSFAALLVAQSRGTDASKTFHTSASAFNAPAGVDLSALDRRTDPCVDFYQFACGGWVTKNPLPADRRSWGRFAELQDRNFEILRRVLEKPAGSGGEGGDVKAGGDRRRAADFYAACMDEATIETKGLSPLTPDLTLLGNLLNPDDLPVVIAHLHDIGVPALFRFSSKTDLNDATQAIADVDQDGLGLPDRDYYLKDDEGSRDLRAKYRTHIETILRSSGEQADEAAADAAAVLGIETALAQAELDRVRRREPSATRHMMTLVELQTLMPAFDWRKYIAAADAPRFQVLNVSTPDFLREENRLLENTPIGSLKSYLRWQLLHASAEMLPKPFAAADFDFFSRTLSGQQAEQPRWRRCVARTDRYLGEALGRAFVDETFSPESRRGTIKIVEDVKSAMRHDIDSALWMSSETKKAAMSKLNAVVDRIGYPDTWRDYSAVRVVKDDALGNQQRVSAFDRQRQLRKIGEPVDRGEWSMTPPTVNAYYSANRNTINFPAGILQPPFYGVRRDAAVNYGAAGAVIGHELTHGFDDQGRKFDDQGNLRDWWTEADAKAFEERASCIANQYSGYTVAGDTHVNGRLTLGENTADNGGLRLALTAYLNGPGAKSKEKLDGFSPEQRVFLGWAQVWCESARPQAERLKAQTNPHSSNKYRVNGPVSNMPEFQKAFQCRPSAAMVRQNQCRVW